MSLHPTITAAQADQHRRPLIVRALRTAAAASAIAAGAFLVIPAGPGPAPSANANWSVHSWTHGSWGMHYRAGDSHRAVLAVHWKAHRFGMDHHFASGHVFGDNPGRWA